MSFSLGTNTDKGAFTIALAASATTDGMDITITGRATGVQVFDFWISEAATGAGLTGDTYSGTVTVSTGTQLFEYTAKKHLKVQTDANGVAVITAVASTNPADQYACVAVGNGVPIVSAVSGTNWEGA